MKLIIQDGITIYCFKSVEEIRGMGEQLIGQAEWIERDDIKPPYLYSRYVDEAPTPYDVKEALKAIKDSLL